MSDITERIERLESIIEDQQETIQAQQARIEELEARRTTADDGGDGTDWIEENVSLSRRSALKTLGLAGLLGYGTASAAADPTGQVGRSDRPVTAVYTETLAGGLTGGTAIDDLLGTDLTTEETDGTTALSADTVDVVDRDQYGTENLTNPDLIEFADDLNMTVEDGTVTVENTSGNSQTDVSDGGSTVVSSTSDIDFGTNLSASSDGDGTATVDADISGATKWQESDSDGLLETDAGYTGIDVADVQTDSLNGGVTGSTDLTSLSGDGLAISGGALRAALGNGLEFNNGLTRVNPAGIAGTGLSEESATQLQVDATTIDHNNLINSGQTDAHHAKDHDHTETDISQVPNSGLVNSSLTVAGNAVSLGNSTGIAHSDLSSIGSSDHHTRPSAGNALAENSDTFDVTSGGIGTSELDLSIAPTWTGTHTWDTAVGANLNVDETGLFYSTSNPETLNLRNTGAGSLTLQEDGTAVVTETRTLTGGNAVQSLGDLSADRTVAVDATALSGTYLGDSGASSALSVNLGSGLEGDGSDNIRVNGGALAGNVLAENGSNPYQVDLNIGNALTDNSGTLAVASGSIGSTELANDSVTVAGNSVTLGNSTTIDHANLSNIGSSDHHTRPSAGNALADNSNTFDVTSGGIGTTELASGAVTGTEIDLSTIAGQNITVDTSNDELDGAAPALAENDSDGLLEIDTGETGIDVATVRVTNLDDANGNGHLTLNTGGNLGLNRALDTNGNGIQSDTSVNVDIDANNDGTSETFTVSQNGGGTTLLTVNEGGEVDINSGDLDLNGNNLTDSTGDLTFSPSGGFVISGGLTAGSGNNVNIDSSTGELLDATASSARYKTNIEPLSTDTSAVLDIEPRSYEYEETGESGVGFIAESVDETFPDLVIYDEQGRPDGIKYHRLGVYLLPEIRRNRESVDDLGATAEEHEARIDDLEAELAAKDARIDDQRDRIERLESETDDLRADNEALRAENERLRERNAELEARVERIEAELGLGGSGNTAAPADD